MIFIIKMLITGQGKGLHRDKDKKLVKAGNITIKAILKKLR